MNSIDEQAVQAAKDDDLLADFITKYEHFIIRCAFLATKKYVSKSDDEWSIALIAFSNAVKTYSQNRGSFLPYAETIVKNKLVDYFRAEQTHKVEYSVSPGVFETEPEVNDDETAIKMAIAEKLSISEDYGSMLKFRTV